MCMCFGTMVSTTESESFQPVDTVVKEAKGREKLETIPDQVDHWFLTAQRPAYPGPVGSPPRGE